MTIRNRKFIFIRHDTLSGLLINCFSIENTFLNFFKSRHSIERESLSRNCCLPLFSLTYLSNLKFMKFFAKLFLNFHQCNILLILRVNINNNSIIKNFIYLTRSREMQLRFWTFYTRRNFLYQFYYSIFQFREKRITLRIFVSKNTKLYNNVEDDGLSGIF